MTGPGRQTSRRARKVRRRWRRQGGRGHLISYHKWRRLVRIYGRHLWNPSRVGLAKIEREFERRKGR